LFFTLGDGYRLGSAQDLPGGFMVNSFFAGIGYLFDLQMVFIQELLGSGTRGSAFTHIAPINLHHSSPLP
jgi:hypothetical protein